MTTRTLLPLFITASLALLLVAAFLPNPDPTTAVNPVPCPTLVPAATATPDGGPTYTATPTYTPCLTKETSTPTVTPTPPPATAMSLRVDAAQTFDCAGGPVAGKVCVDLGAKFDVIVVADAIPPNGYWFAQAWIDYDDQGLTDKKNVFSQWPDCEPATIFIFQDEINNGAATGCMSGLLPPQPPSMYKGDLFALSLTCTDDASSNDMRIVQAGDPIADAPGTLVGTYGALFIEIATFNQFVPSVTGIQVNCAEKPTKQPEPGDTDGDGCSDQRENGPDETLGGQRDWQNPHDFYDVAGSPGPPQNGAPDGIIDLPNDILGVIKHHPAGDLGYDAQFDRGPWTGPNSWNDTQGPDGVIDLPNDILGVLLQFNHNCQ